MRPRIRDEQKCNGYKQKGQMASSSSSQKCNGSKQKGEIQPLHATRRRRSRRVSRRRRYGSQTFISTVSLGNGENAPFPREEPSGTRERERCTSSVCPDAHPRGRLSSRRRANVHERSRTSSRNELHFYHPSIRLSLSRSRRRRRAVGFIRASSSTHRFSGRASRSNRINRRDPRRLLLFRFFASDKNVNNMAFELLRSASTSTTSIASRASSHLSALLRFARADIARVVSETVKTGVRAPSRPYDGARDRPGGSAPSRVRSAARRLFTRDAFVFVRHHRAKAPRRDRTPY